MQERGLVLLGQDEPEDEEDEVGEDEQERRTRAIVSQETANVLAGLGKKHHLVSLSLQCRFEKLGMHSDKSQMHTGIFFREVDSNLENWVVDPNPHLFGKLDQDPHPELRQSKRYDPDPHQGVKKDQDPHKVKRWKSWRVILEHRMVQIWGKVSGRIRTRIWIRIRLLGRILIRIRIRVKGKIRIRIKVKSLIWIRISHADLQRCLKIQAGSAFGPRFFFERKTEPSLP